MADELILKKAATYSLLLMFLVFLFSISFKHQATNISFAGETTSNSADIITVRSTPDKLVETETLNLWKSISGKDYSKIYEKLDDKYIIIKKPESISSTPNISLEEIAVDRRIVVTIQGITNTNSIKTQTIDNSTKEKHEAQALNPLYQKVSLPAELISVEYSQGDQKENSSVHLTYELDKTYAYLISEDEQNYYISLLRPKDIYSKIIVLDAGHGGLDSGTYSMGFEYLEKDVNLKILLYLKKYIEKEDFKVYYTRTTDRRLTLEQRVDLANDVEADLFLSIHCNSSQKPNVNGVEILYNENQDQWKTFNSKQFAEICLKEMIQYTSLNDRGLVPRSNDVQIIGDSHVPVALVEVGFMSNKKDLSFLTKEDNQNLVAKAIYRAILNAYGELETGNNR